MINEPVKGTVKKEVAAVIDNNVGHWFQIIDDEGINLQSQITDNYIENNTAIQDCIAQSPITINLSGYVGEVVYEPPTRALRVIRNKADDYITDKLGFSVSDKLGPIASLLPSVSNVTQLARNAVQYVESSYNRYKKIYDQIKLLSLKEQKQPTETVQQYAINSLRDLWLNRTMVVVFTPWGYYNNMQIQSINIKQGNTNTTTNLSVSLKQMNFATTETTKPNEKVMAKYNAIQRTQEANHGKAQGVEVNNSILYDKFGNNRKY